MEHHSSFLTGFLSGQRLKRWQRGLSSGDSPAGVTNFYGWAAQAGAPDVLADPAAFRQAVQDMPFSRTMDGKLLWKSTVADLYYQNTANFLWMPQGGGANDNNQGLRVYYSETYNAYPNPADNYSGIYEDASSGRYCEISNIDGHALRYRASYLDTSRNAGTRIGLRVLLKAPVAGVYSIAAAFPVFDGGASVMNGNLVHLSYYYGAWQASVSPGGLIEKYRYQLRYADSYDTLFTLVDGCLYLPTFQIQPSDPNPNLSARPGLLTGSPVNENAKTFTNPVTGQIIPFESCEYNYVTRTYTLTLPNGNKMDVAFGDNTIKINDLGGGDGTVPGGGGTMEAMYPDNSGAPVYVPPDSGSYDASAFLSGLAAGMASAGF